MTVDGKPSKVLELQHLVCYLASIRRSLRTVGMSTRQPVKNPSTQMRAVGQAQQDKRLTGSWVARKGRTEVAEKRIGFQDGQAREPNGR